jgi:hypothetical protein
VERTQVSDTKKPTEDVEHFHLDKTISCVKSKTPKVSLSVSSKRWYKIVEENEEGEAALSAPPVRNGHSAHSSAAEGKRWNSMQRQASVAEKL